MTKLVSTASICLVVAFVALLLVTINATGEQPTVTTSSTPTSTQQVELTRTVPATPPGPPSVTPVGQVFAPVVYDMLSTPAMSATPTSTQQVELTRTVPATPP